MTLKKINFSFTTEVSSKIWSFLNLAARLSGSCVVVTDREFGKDRDGERGTTRTMVEDIEIYDVEFFELVPNFKIGFADVDNQEAVKAKLKDYLLTQYENAE